MWPFSLFTSKKDPENFETVLEDLRISIASRRQRLAEMRLRERRATLWTTLYLVAIWAAYAAVWYAGWIYALAGVNRSHATAMLWTKTLLTAPVLVGPVV
jgi:endoplasmic reticulum junction formation protein lunapark